MSNTQDNTPNIQNNMSNTQDNMSNTQKKIQKNKIKKFRASVFKKLESILKHLKRKKGQRNFYLLLGTLCVGLLIARFPVEFFALTGFKVEGWTLKLFFVSLIVSYVILEVIRHKNPNTFEEFIAHFIPLNHPLYPRVIYVYKWCEYLYNNPIIIPTIGKILFANTLLTVFNSSLPTFCTQIITYIKSDSFFNTLKILTKSTFTVNWYRVITKPEYVLNFILKNFIRLVKILRKLESMVVWEKARNTAKTCITLNAIKKLWEKIVIKFWNKKENRTKTMGLLNDIKLGVVIGGLVDAYKLGS